MRPPGGSEGLLDGSTAALGLIGAAGLPEGSEEAPAHRIFGSPPFGVPLDAESEAPRSAHPHPLDGAIRRHRLDDEPFAEPVDRLGVDRVDHDFLGAEEAGEVSGKPHRMEGGVADLARSFLEHVGEAAGIVGEALDEASSQGDVEFLDAAANGQERHAAGEGGAGEGKGGGIPGGVVILRGEVFGCAIEGGVDVARASVEEEPVEPVEQREGGLADRRDEDGKGTGAGDQRVAIAGGGGVVDLAADGAGAGGDADDESHGRGLEQWRSRGKGKNHKPLVAFLQKFFPKKYGFHRQIRLKPWRGQRSSPERIIGGRIIEGSASMTTTVSSGSTLTISSYTNLSRYMIDLAGGATLYLTNKGTLVSTGGQAVYGQFTSSAATVINHGLIADADLVAGSGIAIRLGSGGTVLNYGTIGSKSTYTTNGIFISSPSVTQPASVLNEGTIAPNATASSACALKLQAPENAVTNTGLITVKNSSSNLSQAYGIYLAGGTATITNSGAIIADKPIVAGTATGGVSITNAGTIEAAYIQNGSSRQAPWNAAIQFEGTAPASLTLDPGQTLIGHVTASTPFGLTLAAGQGTLTGAIGIPGGQYLDVSTLTLAQGADWTLTQSASVASGIITDFTTDDTLTLSPAGFQGTLNNLSASDTLVLAGLPYTSSATLSLTSDVLEVMENGTTVAQLTLSSSSYTSTEFGLENVSGDLAITNTIPCFARGTRLATARGDVPVEALRPDDRLRTPDGTFRPLRWVGYRRLRLAHHPDPLSIAPVEIAAHAFGPGRPARALVVSPGHGIYWQGVLLPADHLVNGASVRRLWPAEVEYYHVELDGHGLVLSENLASESYLETENRAAFVPLFGTPLPHPPAPCAPLVFEGPALAAARAALRARLSELGLFPLLSLSLRLVLPSGVMIEPFHRETKGERIRLAFAIPRAAPVRLLAPRAVPAEREGGPPDYRELGFAIHALVWEKEGRRVDIALDGPALGLGWHRPEGPEGAGWRWLAGPGELLLPGAGRLWVTASALPGGVYFAPPAFTPVLEAVDVPSLLPL